MRSLKFSALLLLPLLAYQVPSFAADAKPAYSFTQQKQQSLTPAQAVEKLSAGNQRLVDGNGREYQQSLLMKFGARQGQYPFAFIFNCIDSRSIAEALFDQGAGRLFVGRVAGNVVDHDALAGMEYAVKFVGSKAIVVMGHTSCGAVQAACSNLQTGNLTGLLAKIRPAVLEVENKLHSKNCEDPKLVDAIAKQNVLVQLAAVYQGSEIIRKLVDENKIELVGAMHDINTGRVTFFDRSGKDINR